MKTAWKAMRLGIVIYFIPFFFIFNPALILRGPPLETVYLFSLCLVGIVFIAAGVEGYLFKIGRLVWWSRLPLVAGGFLIAFPETFPNMPLTGIGFALVAVIIAIVCLSRKVVARAA
ncbi:MAG: hypothetical protein ABH839_04295 [Chloroflexota bacterium]